MLQGGFIAIFMYDGNSEWSSDETEESSRKSQKMFLILKHFIHEMYFRYLSEILTLQSKMNLTLVQVNNSKI